MSFLHVIDSDRALGVASLTGRVTADVFCNAMHALYGDPEWRPGMQALWDLRFIDQLIIVPEDISDILAVVDSLRDVLGTGNAAFVTSQEPVHSVARLLVLHSQVPQRDRRVFRDIGDALDWLGVTLPDEYEPSS